MIRTIITGSTVPVLVLVFALTGAPAWAYLLPAAIAAAEAGMYLRARRINTAS